MHSKIWHVGSQYIELSDLIMHVASETEYNVQNNLYLYTCTSKIRRWVCVPVSQKCMYRFPWNLVWVLTWMLSVPPNNMYIGICDLDIDKGQLDFGRSSFSTACTWLRFSFEKTYFAYVIIQCIREWYNKRILSVMSRSKGHTGV